MSYNAILVSICCLTYNHEKYVRQCLDSLVMQKVNFRFEILIHDDASTDKTQQIIKEYEREFPNIIKPIYQTINQYSQGISPLKDILIPKSQGKYIAFCEGDDYWTDPYKLQKQVDFLERHPDYGMVYTAFNRVNINSNIIYNDAQLVRQRKRSKSGWLFYDLVKSNFIQTLTVMFRSCLYNGMVEYYDRTYDYSYFLHISGKAKIYYLNEITGCYRITMTGAMHTGVLSFDNNGRHTLSCALLAFLDGEYSAIPLSQKLLFIGRSLFRLCFRKIDLKKEIIKKMFHI